MTNENDHDILIEIRNDMKHVISKVKEHDDKFRFHDKIIYGFGGVVIFIQIVLPFFTR